MPERRIVVGVDGSRGSQAALRWCAETAPLLDAEVIAVHALAPITYMMPVSAIGPGMIYDETTRRELAAAVAEWCAPLHEASVPYQAEVVDGTPADTIMRIAEKLNADLIVVGRRGHGGFAELVLGSVPHHLSHHADRPVVVVPSA